VRPDDVVIRRAFEVTGKDFGRLRAVGCVLLDTTCGSVLNVWKRVDSYARRLHGRDPRQVLPRGDQGDLEPGDQVSGREVPGGPGHGRGAGGLRVHRGTGDEGRVPAALQPRGGAGGRPGA